MVESRSLVDIVNQTDLVEHPNEKTKMGQPMVHVTWSGDWGALELFGLTWHRPPTFPGRHGRQRSELVVNHELTSYESGAEEWHLDLAGRYSGSFGPLDVGLSVFDGTSRDPTLLRRLVGSEFVLAWAVEPPATRADSGAEEAGLEIATEARERQKGFGNFSANLTMTLRNKRGQESERALRLKVIEIEGDGDRTMFVFDRPRDVKGTAFLVHAHKNEPDEQWLYLPALKRVKRISSSKQSGSFMGSEFSYEDMGAVEAEKYTHRYLHDESCANLQCAVLERIPANRDSGYSGQLVWLDREELRTMQVQFFDRRDEHLKTLVVEDFEKHLDRCWRGGKITMTNHLTGKSTVLFWSDYEFGTELDVGDFTKTALKRAR